METPKSTIRLDDETKELIEKLAKRSGGNRTTVIKQAIRTLARKEGILSDMETRGEEAIQLQ